MTSTGVTAVVANVPAAKEAAVWSAVPSGTIFKALMASLKTS